jgi:hypothetical protein
VRPWPRLAEGAWSACTAGSDVEIGVKWRPFERPQLGALLALEPVVSLPVGSASVSSGRIDPALKVILDRDAPAGFALSANLIMASRSDDRGRHGQLAASLSMAHALFSRWTGFVEIYAASARESSGRSWVTDAGASRPLGRRCQIDVSVGRGFGGATADWFVGAGFAIRGAFGS